MSVPKRWEAAVRKIGGEVEELFSTLYTVCDEIGYNEETRETYCDQAYDHFKGLINDMRDEFVTKKNEILEKITNLLEEIHVLAEELAIDPGLNNYNDQPLVDVKAELENKASSLKLKKQQRLKYLDELLEKERIVCDALGVQPVGKSCVGIPTDEDLDSFKLYLQKQEAEKSRAENTFREMRDSIMKMMDSLSISPALPLEVLVCKTPEDFVFTADNMLKLRELRDNLKNNLEAAKQKAALKREELVELWNLLEVPEASGKAFLSKYSGHSLPEIYALNEEIKRCKQQRTANLGMYVEKVRQQLENLWNMCRIDEVQRRQFKPFYDQTYTEDLLILHDLEVERLRESYNANKKIYDLIDELDGIWEKIKALDQRAQDPERLHNRGGQLLIEEKERKLVNKKFCQVEQQLRGLIQQYENTSGMSFSINGMTFDEFMKLTLDDYQKTRETDKKARLAKAKDKSMKKTPLMSTSRRTPGTATSMLRPGTTGRKRDEKSPLASSKTAKPRLVQSEKLRTVVCNSRIRRSGRVSRRLLAGNTTPNRSHRSKRINSENDTQSTMESVAQYEQFQEHLANRDELRSSVLPEEVLKVVRNKTKKMRTPVKTPVKPMRKNLSTAITPNRTPKSSHIRETSRSPRVLNTPRLATAPTMPAFF